MGIFTKLNDWVSATDMEDVEDTNEEVVEEAPKKEPKQPRQTRASRAERNSAPFTKDCGIAIFHPKSNQEAYQIGDELKNGRAAIVNVADLPKEQSKRITDFLQGIVFALSGNYYIVGDKVILYVPHNIVVNDVDGSSTSEEE